METKFFKTTDGKYLKLDYDYCNDPFDPRDPEYQTNLGTMVFPKERNRRYTLGDKQPESFDEFFKEELSEKEAHDFMEGTIEIELPTLEDCQNNEALSRFVAGTKEIGFHFDVDLFNQELDGILSAVKDNLGASICEDLYGGIPIDENTGKLTNSYIINLRSANCIGYMAAENAWVQIRDELSTYLSDLLPRHSLNITDSIHAYNDLDDLTESQLYDKWVETKLCVIPINIFEHSGMTCHEASLRKTLHVANDRDDGAIYNDGFIYVDKDNKEVLNELKGEARDKEGNVYNRWKAKTLEETKVWAEGILKGEIKEYANALEGNVYDVSIYELDSATLDWGEPVVGYNSLIVDDVEEYIKNYNEYAGKIVEELLKPEMEVILHTPTSEFKKNIFDNYVSKIKEILPDYDNNVKYAASAASLAMKSGGATSLEREALNLYLKENDCTDPESTFKFLEESVGIKGKNLAKELNPLSFTDENLECVFSKIKNPNRSDNGGVNNALLIDYENRRFAYVSGASQMIDKPSETYLNKVEELSSKAVAKKLETLVKAGFKNASLNPEFLNKYRKDDKWISKYILKEPGKGI